MKYIFRTLFPCTIFSVRCSHVLYFPFSVPMYYILRTLFLWTIFSVLCSYVLYFPYSIPIYYIFRTYSSFFPNPVFHTQFSVYCRFLFSVLCLVLGSSFLDFYYLFSVLCPCTILSVRCSSNREILLFPLSEKYLQLLPTIKLERIRWNFLKTDKYYSIILD